jgi:hypothetical protein
VPYGDKRTVGDDDDVVADDDVSRWSRQASRIAFKIAMDARRRLGHRCVVSEEIPSLLSSDFVVTVDDDAPPDNQAISASVRSSDSTAEMTDSSDRNSWHRQ